MGVIVLDTAAGAVQGGREAVTVKVQASVEFGVPFAVAVWFLLPEIAGAGSHEQGATGSKVQVKEPLLAPPLAVMANE